MSRKKLLAYIWQEKREKVISSNIYPIGISITLENINFHWHTIIYGILSLLMKNPEQALEWSRHWGRTTIWVHPKKPLSFKFTEDESLEEKLGVFIDTEEVINPVEFLNQSYNIGHFKIILNKHHLMSLEGAILQVERMIDELVWCNFIKHKKEGQKKEIDYYKSALYEVWAGGITVEYLLEKEILDMKEKDMTLPVRVYGNILNNGKVPNVIGAVIIPESTIINVEDGIDIQRKEILSMINKSAIQLKDYPVVNPVVKINTEKICICTAITLAKEIHVGHLLLLGLANLIQNAINHDCPLYIESNDSGKRIFGLLARLAQKHKTSIVSVVKMLVNEEYSPDEINSCYKTRIEKGYMYYQAQRKLKRNRANLLSVMNKNAHKDLGMYGFKQINIIPDSSCIYDYERITEIANQGWRNTLGFKFIKYTQGRHKKMVVLEKQGIPTASAMRAAFIGKILSINKKNILPIFVDMDNSVVQACDVIRLAYCTDMLRIDGAAIGFEMKIASGTSGNVMSADWLYRVFCKKYDNNHYPNFFLSTVTFFLLTRYATAKSDKKCRLSKGHPLGLSFYDYKDSQALLEDFLLCAENLLGYQDLIRKIQQKIKYSICKECKNIELNNSRIGKEKVNKILIRLKKIGRENVFHKIFLPSKIENLEYPLRKIREKIYQKSCIDDYELIDRIIVELAVRNRSTTLKELNDVLLSKGIISSPLLDGRENMLTCIFVDSLRSRGYKNNEIISHSLAYLRGEFCLLRKRCIYFDILQDIILVVKNTLFLSKSNAEVMQEAILTCIRKLGIYTGEIYDMG